MTAYDERSGYRERMLKAEGRAEDAEKDRDHWYAKWVQASAMQARAEAAEKREAALRKALAEIAYLESPQIRGKPRRKSIGDIARAALEAKP